MSFLPRATIQCEQIAANWRTLNAIHSGATTAAVVKANAYGLGLPQVSRALKLAGCESFFVAYSEEGVAVRKTVGKGPRIFVLNGPVRGELAVYRDAELTAVLSSEHHLKLWSSAARGTCALHFDTGMNRLGLSRALLETETTALQRLAPVLVMSHLACADDASHPMNKAQRAAFDEICTSFPDTPASLANSAGCYLGRAYAYDLVRPGIALYGGSHPPKDVTLKAALTLEGAILGIFKGRKGETVGYGATHVLEDDRVLATCGIGYADGLIRSGAGRLLGWIDGVACPVLGRISMDLVTLDITDAVKTAKPGARVEFLGENAKLEVQAAMSGTLGYELLTGLGNRVQRIYR